MSLSCFLERSAPFTCSANKVNTIESNNSTAVSVIDEPMDPWVSRRQNAQVQDLETKS